MEMTDIRSFLSVLTRPKSQDKYCLAVNGSRVFGYKCGLRVFFEWLHKEPQYGDFGFYDNIELLSQRAERVSDGQTLNEEDVEAFKTAGKKPRDSALVDFLADNAARVSLLPN